MDTNDLQKLQDQARNASALLKAMSNQYRLLILCQLLQQERSVGELERVVGLSQSALSQHLARLRRDDLVKTRRVAQTIFYSLKGEEVAAVLHTLYGIYCAPAEASGGHADASADLADTPPRGRLAGAA
ncbi:helix-turn-helix transcriptional regulator [Roseospira marina]|uniref:Helix-turn-helix transcriptional regulator n=1 Tax=Roseospira marina TaxID=140057 RepID=A0A5M6ICU5_9PROT|nr:metalloregulator ArsR/SmtB family transcription factor [Roseospira marina]KAA5606091.1 helix-turn-helix transcriptional regulator [Roseospira marina]MBB4313043.1 DNA-binding transcriptional ArsR family regulator [Roseospira marina]MBB5086216.1 DNA-binding transcriptional ArsR family regulator [Roseospira marina]